MTRFRVYRHSDVLRHDYIHNTLIASSRWRESSLLCWLRGLRQLWLLNLVATRSGIAHRTFSINFSKTGYNAVIAATSHIVAGVVTATDPLKSGVAQLPQGWGALEIRTLSLKRSLYCMLQAWVQRNVRRYIRYEPLRGKKVEQIILKTEVVWNLISSQRTRCITSRATEITLTPVKMFIYYFSWAISLYRHLRLKWHQYYPKLFGYYRRDPFNFPRLWYF